MRIHPKTSTTMVGGREAKKEQTQVVVQGAYHMQVNKEYLENRPETSPLCIPMCHSSNRGPYLDLRIYRALVFLYQVQSQCNAGPYESILTGVQDRPAAMRYLERSGAAVLWQARVPNPAYWVHAKGLPETLITITAAPEPHGRWVGIPKAAQMNDKYQVKCMHHECPAPHGLADTYTHVHGQAKVRPEVQDAMRVLLAEIYTSNRPGDRCPEAEDGPVQLYAMPVEMGPRTYLEPRLEPGVHFHRLPDLATTGGYIMAWDAGNPSADDHKEAREVEELNDPRGMAAAIVQEEDGEVIEYTVVRGPAIAGGQSALDEYGHQICPRSYGPASGG